MLMSISIPYTCIQLHNNQYKWTKKLECMLKHHLTQFDKTLTLKLYIKIAYKKQYNPEPHLWTSIQPPPPSIVKTNKKAILQRHGKCFKTTRHVCKTVKDMEHDKRHSTSVWTKKIMWINIYSTPGGKISHYIKKKPWKDNIAYDERTLQE